MSNKSKRILSLDGGGVRGAITIAFLERIETVLREKHGQKASFGEQFDLIGGTSTGSIIGSALALGKSAREIRDFYFDLGPRIFKRSRWRLIGVQSVFDAKPLKQELTRICGDVRMEDDAIKTGLAIVMKRLDTASAWIISNNPASKYWNDPDDGAYIGNKHFRLADLIRASTAAPHYFAPEQIQLFENLEAGVFVDGGVTPHNNPALAMLQLATIPAYGYGWEVGVDKLSIISIGTGSHRTSYQAKLFRHMTSAGSALRALAGMIDESQSQVMTLMQALGQTDTPWEINSEIGDLDKFVMAQQPLFKFLRYDIRLEPDWLKDNLNIDMSEPDVAKLRALDNADAIPKAHEVGAIAAEKLVKPEHF